MLLTLLLTTLGLLVQGSSGDKIVTQTPGSLSVVPGQTVSIRCKASESVSNEVEDAGVYYCQQDWSFPFTQGTGSSTDFTLTISRVQAEDAGVSYCQQDYSLPFTQDSVTAVWEPWVASQVTEPTFLHWSAGSLRVLLQL
ncbi:hypothetical protein XENOCAPTIV_017735 [Xenoophorus captivus]|uniref:Ig-like domain-containing protein n=1 Tax=Xenoophorus captivus TaxID=1517983 RepID=A0ABV0R0Y6_9TELE